MLNDFLMLTIGFCVGFVFEKLRGTLFGGGENGNSY